MSKKYEKNESESQYEYGLRLIKIKVEEKPDDLEWADIVDLLELDIHKDTLRKAASTTPYSGYAVMKYFIDKEDPVKERKRSILSKDEITVLNQKIREQARTDRLIDIFKEVISQEVTAMFSPVPATEESGKTSITVMLSDIHYGITCNSIYNHYNPEIASERLRQYISDIKIIAARHDAKTCHLFLGGDLISGNIHPTINMENAFNVITQLKGISVLLSEFTHELSSIFSLVEVHHVPGNHSRITQKPKDNRHGDYLDSLIPFYMRYALQNQENIRIYENECDDEICAFDVQGHLFTGIHGHRDTPASVTGNMIKMLKKQPDVILMGHLHENSFQPSDGSRVVQCGSLSGMDSYSIEHRLVSKPEQMIIVSSEKQAIECLYPIRFE